MHLEKTYNAPVGNNYIVDPEMLYSKIMLVCVDTVQFDVVINQTAGNRQVQYIPGFGFQWLNNFNGNEKVYIWAKTPS